MSQTRLIPLFIGLMIAGAAAAETESFAPRILAAPQNTEAVLPGAKEGTAHGVIVRRGSGFPVPVTILPETVTTEPPPRVIRRVIRRKKHRW